MMIMHKKLLYAVQDVDGDDVRCRWAVGNECGDSYYYGAGVCQDFPATLSMVWYITIQDACMP